MDKEIATFRENDCIEEIRLADLEDNVNAVSTRWVLLSTRECPKLALKLAL
jgi:hypothetical protein